MNRKNMTRNALFTSIISLLLCVSMLVGTTFAWFTDSVTSAGNKIAAGNLDVDLYQWTAADASAEITNESAPLFGEDIIWEPGRTQVVYLSIKNAGSLNLKYNVSVSAKDTDAEQDLYEAMQYAIIRDAKYGSVTAWNNEGAMSVVPGVNATEAGNVSLAPEGEHFFALAIHMKEEAGNKYQMGSVEFDIRVDATQLTAESDSFGDQYDADSTYDLVAGGEMAVNPTATEYDIPLKKADEGKVGSVVVPAAAVADNATKVAAHVRQTAQPDATVVVAADQSAKTYDVTVTGIKEGTRATFKVTLNIGAGMTGVELYHNDQLMDKSSYTYNSEDGILIFETDSFSPYTVVYDKVAADTEVETPDKDIPTAKITELTIADVNAELEWSRWGDFYPGDDAQLLESAYLFEAPHDYETIDACAYKNWSCDYYVKLVSDSLNVLPAGYITLGGNYGTYNWVGFDNPDVNANEWIPLLGSVFKGGNEEGQGESGWTYADIVTFVKEFKCGVGRTTEGMENLAGAQFVVALRLTNPATGEFVDVNTVTYTFGDTFGEGISDIQ